MMRRLAAILVAFLLVLTACGGDDEGGGFDAEAFTGIDVTVGSKNFTEQYVLSEILIQALAARGANVTDAIDTGDTPTTRAALLAGDIDLYWEYNSTGWVEHLGQADPPNPEGEELTESVAEIDSERNSIEWIGRSSFNDTYGFAPSPEIAEETQASRITVEAFDLEGMADYLEDNSDTIVCVEPEFPNRADGLVLFEEETGFEIPQDRIRVFDNAADIYEAVATGICDFGEIFTTDGRIDSLDLTVVVDPGVFYVYNVSLNIPTNLYQRAPEAWDDLVEEILAPLSQNRITELNRRVAEGEPLSDVAADFIRTFRING